MCSKHSAKFVICITKYVPLDSISLDMVSWDYTFDDKDIKNMIPSDKRFLLYYYYATTVYQFHGSGNRVELPECLKTVIRSKYPNEHSIEMCKEDSNKDKVVSH